MLDVQDITVAYSSNAEPTIEGFHLEMKPGEICSIVGESGSGKTTVIRSILMNNTKRKSALFRERIFVWRLL